MACPWTQLLLAEVVQAVRGTRYGMLFEFMLYAGVRPGEALGCHPGDLNLVDGQVLVERALDESTWHLKPTKT